MQPAYSLKHDRLPRHWHSRFVTFAMIVMIVSCVESVHAGGLVRVSNGHQNFEGKVIALSGSTCSLIDREGHLHRLNVSTLKSFEKLGPRFRPFTTSQLRDSLRKEFPDGYEVSGTTNYLVCAPVGRATQYGKLFDRIYRDVEHFFRVRGFDVHKPEMPLIAVVFRNQKEFVEYCLRDKVPPSPGLMGYYSLTTNRVALFDSDHLISATEQVDFHGDDAIAALTAISGDTADTIIHETTHQVGYNIGIHSRLGGTPVWVVEGLATVLEPPAVRSGQGRPRIQDRLNRERMQWFESRHRPDRRMGSLALLVASDQYFHQQTLNKYSESWAFTFFLLENATRQRHLTKYLKTIAERDPNQRYTAEQRLEDFTSAFGDIARLEVDFIRFMDQL